MLTGSACAPATSSPKNSNSMCAITTRYGARLPSGFARSTQVSAKARARGATRSNETVPGVGPIVALTAIAVFADGSRSEIAKHAASYSGLVPGIFQSGERDAYCRITKRGSAELRAMLCEAAHHARRLKRVLAKAEPEC